MLLLQVTQAISKPLYYIKIITETTSNYIILLMQVPINSITYTSACNMLLVFGKLPLRRQLYRTPSVPRSTKHRVMLGNSRSLLSSSALRGTSARNSPPALPLTVKMVHVTLSRNVTDLCYRFTWNISFIVMLC